MTNTQDIDIIDPTGDFDVAKASPERLDMSEDELDPMMDSRSDEKRKNIETKNKGKTQWILYNIFAFQVPRCLRL
jgi:hypothetical protein